MKKRVTQITALLLAVGMLVGCGKGSTVSSNATLNPEDFEGTENFITIVDCPPNPLDEKGMELFFLSRTFINTILESNFLSISR